MSYTQEDYESGFDPEFVRVLLRLFRDTGGVGTRILNCLNNEGLITLERLLALTEQQLRDLPNLGRRSVDLIVKELAKHGLALTASPPRPEVKNPIHLCPHCGTELKIYFRVVRPQ